MSDDNMNGDTPEIPAQLPPDRGLSPLPGPQDRRAPGGSGPLAAARAAVYGLDPYGGGSGFLLAKNRFQETSALMARLHRYELSLRKHWWILGLALCVSLGPAADHSLPPTKSSSSTGKLWMSGKLDIKE